MILNLSDDEFKKIFSNKNLYLPIRWNNGDFACVLRELFDDYIYTIERGGYGVICSYNTTVNTREIKRVCTLIVNAVRKYLDGFPGDSFKIFNRVMSLLSKTPLQTYYKSIMEQFESHNFHDSLNLYRVTCVNDNIPYDRNRVFHTPYCLRSKVSTSWYSIAGFPSLYLGTSLELCCEEVNYNPHNQFALASRFQIERNFEYNNTEIKVVELAIKPQDFTDERNLLDKYINTRVIRREILERVAVREAYLLWYPLIAACSFIRANKKDPFAAEYIIPQLLMQWVRKEIETTRQTNNSLIGIRYFSCASMQASDKGFNYVFPASGKQTKYSFCPILSKAFKLTKPHFLHDHPDISSCQHELNVDNDMDFVEQFNISIKIQKHVAD